jgi:hypothetical protein
MVGSSFSAQAVATVSSWQDFTDANITNKYTITTDWNTGAVVAMDDTYGVISYCTGAAVDTQRTIPYTRSGTTLTFGTETTRSFVRGTDRTYSGVKMSNYAVIVANFGKNIIVGNWGGGTTYTWGSQQTFSSLNNLDRHSIYALSDTCLLVFGIVSNAPVVRLFSRSGSTFTHQSDTTISFTATGIYGQIIPLEDTNKFIVSIAGSTNSQVALITVNPTTFAVTQDNTSSTLSNPYIIGTNSNFRVGQTITGQNKGNHGILTFSKYAANYQYVEIVPTSVSSGALTIHTSNAIQITDNTTGDDRPWSFDILKLNSEWYLLHTAYFDDSGNDPNRVRRFSLIKYNTSNNTVSEHYSWNAANPTQNLIISIRAWVSQLNDDYLLFLSNEDTAIGNVKAYIVARSNA